MHLRAWSLLSCEVSVRVRGNPPVTPLGTLEHKRFQNGIRLEVKLVSAPDHAFRRPTFRTPAFQQGMWVKILPCAPQCGSHLVAKMPAFQAENEGASPSYRTKNLEF
jgi:hypothetical protein